MNNTGIVKWLFPLVMLVVVFFSVRSYYKEASTKAEKKAEADKNAVAQLSAPAAPQAPVVIGKERTSYEFGSDGCVEVFLTSGKWSGYPKGGKIKYIQVSTGQKVLEDQPGTTITSSLETGWYRICAAESKATGVEIWQ